MCNEFQSGLLLDEQQPPARAVPSHPRCAWEAGLRHCRLQRQRVARRARAREGAVPPEGNRVQVWRNGPKAISHLIKKNVCLWLLSWTFGADSVARLTFFNNFHNIFICLNVFMYNRMSQVLQNTEIKCKCLVKRNCVRYYLSIVKILVK